MHSLARLFIRFRSLHRQGGSENEGGCPADCENWLPERGGETSRYDPGPPLAFKIVKHEAVGKSLPPAVLARVQPGRVLVFNAIVPMLQGMYADAMGVLYSFAIPLVCYLYIAHYGYRGHRLESARLAMVSKPA